MRRDGGDPSGAAPRRPAWVALGPFLGLLPAGRIKNLLLNRMLGWDVAPSAAVQPCILFRVGRMALAAGAQLHGGSVYRNLDEVVLGERAVVGSWNWVAAARTLRMEGGGAPQSPAPACLNLGSDAAITSRHYIDCSGGVMVGAFAVVAGVRSTVMTHQVDTARSEQSIAPVLIDRFSLVSSNVKIAPGARIPERCLIAMGSVVVGALPEPGMLYGGVPARPLRPVGDGRFFSRSAAKAHIP